MTKPREPLTFKEWKKAFTNCVSFGEVAPNVRAASIVVNAYVSKVSGELTPRGFNAAIRWAYSVDHGGAWLEEQRQKERFT